MVEAVNVSYPLSSVTITKQKPRIRTYPHFDAALAEADAETLVNSPQLVARHAFHPFIEYSERWTKFSTKGQKGATKSRPIKYASRRDSCIYSHYRELISAEYEKALVARGIGDVVLAYRRVPRLNGKGNKNNIYFANDVFQRIRSHGACTVYTLDISSFFETIDHAELKRIWMQVMGFKTMPRDHFCVFRSITSYATVDRLEAYRALGFVGQRLIGNRLVEGYLKKRIPLQICLGQEFRAKVVPLIRTNTSDHGIPQGSPMSDVLANMYLLEFDTAMTAEMRQINGEYFRYSDDILLIVPGTSDNPAQRLDKVEKLLRACGKKLVIQSAKSTVHRFSAPNQHQVCEHIEGKVGKNGLEYLGFRFDGQHVYLRDSTRSRLQRKMAFSVNREVRRLIEMNPGCGRAVLKDHFDVSFVLQQFYKVRDFESVARIPKEWTFWTYVMRAQKVLGNDADVIGRQVAKFKRSIRRRADKIIDKLVTSP